MKYTTNLNLKKPDQEDFYNVDDFNYNADIIDTELANFTAHLADATPHRFIDNVAQKTYKYGFKKQNNHLVFVYEEVV